MQSIPHLDGQATRAGVPTLVLLVVLSLTVLVAAYAWVSIEVRERLRFESAAQNATGSVASRLETYVAMLRSTRALFAANSSTSRRAFHRFVENLNLPSQYPGIQAIAYSVRMRAEQSDSLLRELRNSLGEDVSLWPDQGQAEHHVITYIEPLDRRNRAAIGYDMFTEPNRRAAMKRARDLGSPSASRGVRLVQEIDEETQAGFLIYLAVYATPYVPPTIEERRDSLRGFVYCPIRVADLFHGIFGASGPPMLDLRVYEGDEPTPGALLYASTPLGTGQPHPLGGRSTQTELSVAGQRWTLVFHDQPAGLISSGVLAAGLILLAGCTVSLVLFAATRAQARDRAVALRIAADLRRSREQIYELNRVLERRVAERTAAAESRAVELARSNADLEQFAYVASHDLQEPLRMVANYTELLGRRYEGQLDADADEYIRFAVDGVRRMERLIKGLLAYSRAGGAPLAVSDVDLNLVSRQAVTNLQQAIEESQAQVVVEPLPHVQGDANQLLQVFQNLLGNAIKFRRDGEPPRICVRALGGKGADPVTVSVSDNGIGISPEHAERIFVIFQRLHSRAEYPGTGIGLAICKRIVERHGGRIWAQPAPGGGTEFRFTLAG